METETVELETHIKITYEEMMRIMAISLIEYLFPRCEGAI